MEKLKCVVSISYIDFDFGEDYKKAIRFMQLAEFSRTDSCRIECHMTSEEVDDEEES